MTSLSLPADTAALPGLDYTFLREQGVARIQALAGSIWTDYNEHDPGVTTLEQLCYALTELSYRAVLPLPDLLADPDTGHLDPHRQGLFVPARIFPCNPLTVDDYRKLIVDRIEAVRNAWLEPLPSPPQDDSDGFYRIVLYVPEVSVCGPPGSTPDEVAALVRRLYLAHRNLCEDLGGIVLLQPLATVVQGDVTLESDADPDQTLAGLYFALGLCLAPELHRESLAQRLASGAGTAAIFTGPLLENGFIDDAQLLAQPRAIDLVEVTRTAAHCPGVVGVRGLRVSVTAVEPRHVSAGCIKLPPDCYARIATAPGANGRYALRLLRNGAECRPDPARVQRTLDRLWADYRRPYPLVDQYEEYLGLPAGQRRDLREYYSIQNQYPACYGIGSRGLPGDAPALRRGQARQLKGYLLPFEQLLADYFAQLARLRDLYCLLPALPCDPLAPGAGAAADGDQCTYFYQSLERSVPDVEPLLTPGYGAGLAALVRAQDPGASRRNRFLAFLLALYAEHIGEVGAGDCRGPGGAPPADRLLGARLAMLDRLVESTHDRARGIDYLSAPGRRNIAGMVIKSRIQLACAADDPIPIAEALQAAGMVLTENEAEVSFGHPLGRHNASVEKEFRPFAALPDAAPGAPAAGAAGLGMRRMTAPLLAACSDHDNLRIGALPGVEGVVAVGRAPGETVWRLIGRYPDETSAGAELRALVAQAGSVYRTHRRLYIVEHNLLRWARDKSEASGPGTAPFVYSMTLTAVASLPDHADPGVPDAIYDAIYEVIRENTPAHLACELCLLGLTPMVRFEGLYWAWRDALQEQDESRMQATSLELRGFLQLHRQRAGAAGP